MVCLFENDVMSIKTGRRGETNKTIDTDGKKTVENRRRIGNTWRLENSRNALWTQKQNGYFVTAAADEQ
jgi:hypothetical protein